MFLWWSSTKIIWAIWIRQKNMAARGCGRDPLIQFLIHLPHNLDFQLKDKNIHLLTFYSPIYIDNNNKILSLYSRGISPQTNVQHLKPVLHEKSKGSDDTRLRQKHVQLLHHVHRTVNEMAPS